VGKRSQIDFATVLADRPFDLIGSCRSAHTKLSGKDLSSSISSAPLTFDESALVTTARSFLGNRPVISKW
jgi:hypothetical protein